MYFHNGTPYRYSAWQPITVNGTAPYAKPLYYGNLFTSTVFAGGDKQVVNLVNETALTAYAVYNASQGEAGAALDSVVVVNLEMFNVSQSAEERTSVEVQLPLAMGEGDGAMVRRLTARGVDAKEGITFAGQSVDEEGKIVGALEVEGPVNGTVTVRAGEAVMISI